MRVPSRQLLQWVSLLLTWSASGDGAVLVPAKLDPDVTVEPNAPYELKVPIGQAQLVQFGCWARPADAVLTLRSYSKHSDALMFVSFGDPDSMSGPDLSNHDVSTFDQWREDSSGDHHLVLRAVGPDGGVLGLLNTRHFAKEEFYGILTLQCNYIMAFDAFFWDHLKLSVICPIGEGYGSVMLNGLPEKNIVCSDRGRCNKYSECECAAGWTGPACASQVYELVASSEHHYDLQVERGKYKYFRVRIPPFFKGGFLEVNVTADAPLVVLISGPDKDLPTKSKFDLSNFDAWLEKRKGTRLQFRVPGVLDSGFGNRRLVDEEFGRPRHLAGIGFVSCPRISPGWQSQSCHTKKYASCDERCTWCMTCNKTAAVDDACTAACEGCLGSGCIDVLSNCAASVGCMNDDAQECEGKCTSCMACLDSSDPACAQCGCCNTCLPLAAKCGLLSTAFDDISYLHVAVLNHRKLGDQRPVIEGLLDLGLREEPSFVQPTVTSDWIATLYDRFADMQDLEYTQRSYYPDGDQFLYDFNLNGSDVVKDALYPVVVKEVRLYNQRLTLLHVLNSGNSEEIELSFSAGADITHVLSSAAAAPKTLFDFEQVHAQTHGKVHIEMIGKSDIWCALFANDDSSVIVTATAINAAAAGGTWGKIFSVPSSVAVCVLAILCGLCYGTRKSRERNAAIVEPSEAQHGFISDRLGSLVRGASTGASERSQGRSLSGYVSNSQDYMDPSVEEQYLFRGGIGDDGM